MTELVLHGDIEAACVAILDAAPEISAFYPERITTDLVDYQAGDLWVVVQRQGGATRYPCAWIEKPRVDFDVYGRRRTTTAQLAQLVQAVMLRDAIGYSGHGVTITDVRVETGILRADDRAGDNIPRYVLSLRLTTVPHAASRDITPPPSS